MATSHTKQLIESYFNCQAQDSRGPRYGPEIALVRSFQSGEDVKMYALWIYAYISNAKFDITNPLTRRNYTTDGLFGPAEPLRGGTDSFFCPNSTNLTYSNPHNGQSKRACCCINNNNNNNNIKIYNADIVTH